jgi:hypothetical protein
MELLASLGHKQKLATASFGARSSTELYRALEKASKACGKGSAEGTAEGTGTAHQ